jgi:uncharacterized protein (TIGR02996 family)
MDAQHSFLQAILDQPDDDAIRLVYSDWLDEHGQPERAEFIRVQIELTRLSEDDPRWWDLKAREEDLLLDHGKAWVRELPEGMSVFPSLHEIVRTASVEKLFRRGFLAEARATPSVFAQRAETLFRAIPLETLRLIEGTDATPLTASPWLSRLSCLSGSASGLRPFLSSPELPRWLNVEHLEWWSLKGLCQPPMPSKVRRLEFSLAYSEPHTFFTGPNVWENLTELHLAGISFADSGLEFLARSANFPRLQTLRFLGTYISRHGWRALAQSPHFQQLRSLSILGHDFGFGEAEMRELSAANWPALTSFSLTTTPRSWPSLGNLTHAVWSHHLKTLILPACDLEFDAASELIDWIESPSFANMRRLEIGSVPGDGCLTALARSPHAANLGHLALYRWDGALASLEVLAASENIRRLHTLELVECQLPRRAMLSLARSRQLTGLRRVSMYSTGLDGVTLRGLLNADWMSQVQNLDLRRNAFSDTAVETLAASAQLANVRRLDLGDNRIGDAGALALAQSPYLGRLVHLGLHYNQISDAGAIALASSPYLPRLFSLDVCYNPIQRRGLQALKERFGDGLFHTP